MSPLFPLRQRPRRALDEDGLLTEPVYLVPGEHQILPWAEQPQEPPPSRHHQLLHLSVRNVKVTSPT